MSVYATPAVRAVAQRLGVDLALVTGTGVGGRITVADVQSAAGQIVDRPRQDGEDVYAWAAATGRIPADSVDKHRTQKTPAALLEQLYPAMAGLPAGTGSVGRGSKPRPALAAVPSARATEQRSAWNRNKVRVDPWARNPLVDDIRQADPDLHRAASSEGPAPTLFQTGDLPIFITSGTDPAVLLRLPWQARHAAAAAAAAELTTLLEQYANQPAGAAYAFADHPGNREYRARVHDWLSGNTPAARALRDQEKRVRDAAAAAGKPIPKAARASAMYDTMYGDHERHQAQLRADAEEDRAARARFDTEQANRERARRER